MGNSLLAVRGINHKYIVVGKDVAVWKAALDELKSNKLAVAVGYKNEIFQLTKYGYEVSEKICH